MVFTSLAYLIDIDWLYEAYCRTRKDGAAGIDGVTSIEYEQDLEGNLKRLLDRLKSGTYRAPAVRRVYIPKGGSSSEVRPIGIPTLEDKVLQRAIVMLLEPIYEQDFLDCSYGFRPGRSAHHALGELRQRTMDMAGGWILEVDIRKFFDDLNHEHLRGFLQHRICDGVVNRLLHKWLRAGISENGAVSYPDSGSPQGGVVSPMLSNMFLHYVLDVWFAQEVRPRLTGDAFLIRFADDFAIGFRHKRDALAVNNVLPKRFKKFGLSLHPTKTCLVNFHSPAKMADRDAAPDKSSVTFDLLGFTHYWGRSRWGKWVVKRKTASSRFSRGMQAISRWCRYNRHRPVVLQYHPLKQKLLGHYAYYGINGNYQALNRFLHAVKHCWHKWLNRRNRQRELLWSQFQSLLDRYPLPNPRIVHRTT